MPNGGLFRGMELRQVEADGRTLLPGFVMRALGDDRGDLVLGLHEHSPCLSGYDTRHEARLADDIERRRLREEERGIPPAVHEARLRRTFAAAAAAAVGEGGDCRLPPLLRRRGRIEGLALFVGTGPSFEIWNPSLALEAEDEVLRGLAADMLAQAGVGQSNEEEEK